MNSIELLRWVDNAGTAMLWTFEMYKKTGDKAYLVEVKEAITTFQAVVDELTVS